MKLPTQRELSLAIHSFTKRERILFFVSAIIFVFSALAITQEINKLFMVEVPAEGGSLTEGTIGPVRFVNPLLASSDADRDLTQLIYSGLLRINEKGEYANDLAEKYEVSPDGLTYTFTIKEEALWHDGKQITADDVEFTILKARDPIIKSPKRAGWEGVSIEKISNKRIAFRLKQPYAPFLENALMGILPKHIWQNVDSEMFTYSNFNINPIGSGPYKIKNVTLSASGMPEYYQLEPFKYFTLAHPKITTVGIKAYQNKDALISGFEKGEVGAISAIPAEDAVQLATKSYEIDHMALPRIFGVFFNQNSSKALSDISARKALGTIVDKQKIIDDVLHGYGAAIDSPVPKQATGLTMTDPNRATSSEALAKQTADRTETAKKILQTGGWKWNAKKMVWEKTIQKQTVPLSISLSTSNTPELKQAAEMIRANWESLGVKVTLKIFEIGDLNQNVIRARKYDALFFGEVIGRYPDLFSFWHSSQRNDPGLNVAMYTNARADKMLTDARTTADLSKRDAALAAFEKEIKADYPAIFIYSPYFTYTYPSNIKNLKLAPINIPSDRLFTINEWHIVTDRVWKIFAPER